MRDRPPRFRVSAGAATVMVFGTVTLLVDGPAPAPARAAEVPITVTRDDPSLPAGCRPAKVARRVSSFLRRYSRGDRDLARRLTFRRPNGDRGWFSMSDPAQHDVARNAGAASRLFARRHRRGEELKLRELAVGARDGLGHIEFNLERSASDETADLTEMSGKGAVVCASGKLFVWSAVTPSDAYALCPAGDNSDASAIRACSR